MQRPKVKISKTLLDWMLEIVALLALLITFISIIINYNALPDIIARHFNASGTPDGFGSKSLLWILTGISVLFYCSFTLVGRIPHVFNFPYEITIDNAERQYRNAITMINVMKAMLTILFLYLTYASIQTGLGNLNGLGMWFLPIFLILTVGVVEGFLYRGSKLK